jgi:hypothetical protein
MLRNLSRPIPNQYRAPPNRKIHSFVSSFYEFLRIGNPLLGIYILDFNKFDFDRIRNEIAKHPTSHYIVCVDCGELFDLLLPRSLLSQHFDSELHGCAIDIENFSVISMRTFIQAPVQHFLKSFFITLS